MKIKKVKKLVNCYKKSLKLHGWKFEILISEKPMERSKAEISYEVALKEATIVIDKEANIEDKELKKNILHELLHIFLSQYTEYSCNFARFVHENPENVRKLSLKNILKNLEKIEEKMVIKLTELMLKMGG